MHYFLRVLFCLLLLLQANSLGFISRNGGIAVAQAPAAGRLPRGSRVVIAPMGGFETYFAAAVRKKEVPITLTLDRDSAQYFVVSTVIANARERYAVIFALLAGTGLRIGEALALKPTDLSPDCRVLRVRRSIWHGKEQQPKTPNAVREIDLPESLAAMLRGYAANKSGYLFATSSGRPLAQRNVLRAVHATGKKVGLHAFRRFRTETLRRARVPEDLTTLWLGHSKQTVTDFYASGLQKDEAWRREWCERVGLGFSLHGLLGLQNVVPINSVKVA